MAVNYLHSLLHRPEKGWDPIPADYARDYAGHAWSANCSVLVEQLEQQIGGLAGKRVLDLGGGPGQYTVALATRGADVTWHDVSHEYLEIARHRLQSAGVSARFSVGYLEGARCFVERPFDLVFCRVCWYYARSDRSFAQLIYSLVKPGGMGYVECNTPAFSNPEGLRRIQYWLNEHLWWKVGHPMPPHGRIERLLRKYPMEQITTDYSSETTDVVLFVKQRTP
jgi:SAM-dependent methyltransferase